MLPKKFYQKKLNKNQALHVHNHKKRKDSLGTWAELAVLRTYFENQAILEPILLYRSSRYKQTKEQGSNDGLSSHVFIFLCDYCQLFFFFFQNANKPGSKCATIGCNLSKKYKLALYKTQRRAKIHRS